MSVTRKFQVKPLGKLLANGGGGEVVDHGPGGREKERHVKPSLDISCVLIHGRGGGSIFSSFSFAGQTPSMWRRLGHGAVAREFLVTTHTTTHLLLQQKPRNHEVNNEMGI